MHFTYTLGPFYKQAVKHRWNWPNAHGLILGTHRTLMRRTHNTNTQTWRGYVSAVLTQEGRASSARRDGHSSKLSPRSPDQPHTSQDPALSHHSYSQSQAKQKTGNGWKETVLLPAIHQKDSGNYWPWDYQKELQQPEEKANPQGLTPHINNKRQWNLHFKV